MRTTGSIRTVTGAPSLRALRTAAAAGVAQVLLSKRCAFAWSPKVLRAAQGAHFCIDLCEDVDLPAWAADFRDAGGEVIATVAAGGTSLYDAFLAGRAPNFQKFRMKAKEELAEYVGG